MISTAAAAAAPWWGVAVIGAGSALIGGLISALSIGRNERSRQRAEEARAHTALVGESSLGYLTQVNLMSLMIANTDRYSAEEAMAAKVGLFDSTNRVVLVCSPAAAAKANGLVIHLDHEPGRELAGEERSDLQTELLTTAFINQVRNDLGDAPIIVTTVVLPSQ